MKLRNTAPSLTRKSNSADGKPMLESRVTVSGDRVLELGSPSLETSRGSKLPAWFCIHTICQKCSGPCLRERHKGKSACKPMDAYVPAGGDHMIAMLGMDSRMDSPEE